MKTPRMDSTQVERNAAGAARLSQIAVARLDAARAMYALRHGEGEVLEAIDLAALGELSGEVADAALRAHLEARDELLALMLQGAEEWKALAREATEWSDAMLAPVAAISNELSALLVEIEASDARFAAALAARRDTARGELTRTDTARAAGRAYGGSESPGPRFTDRRA